MAEMRQAESRMGAGEERALMGGTEMVVPRSLEDSSLPVNFHANLASAQSDEELLNLLQQAKNSKRPVRGPPYLSSQHSHHVLMPFPLPGDEVVEDWQLCLSSRFWLPSSVIVLVIEVLACLSCQSCWLPVSWQGERQSSYLKCLDLSPKRLSWEAVVNYGAPWCHACRQMLPTFCNLSNDYSGALFIYADVDKCTETTQDVRYTPTFRFYRDGDKVDEFYGAGPQRLRDRVWLHS